MEPTKGYLKPLLSRLKPSVSIFRHSRGESGNFILEVEWQHQIRCTLVIKSVSNIV